MSSTGARARARAAGGSHGRRGRGGRRLGRGGGGSGRSASISAATATLRTSVERRAGDLVGSLGLRLGRVEVGGQSRVGVGVSAGELDEL
jgi:hypothetical protein